MSASREKKQRQTIISQGPTQAQIREQKEAAAKKRKTILYWVIGIVIVIAVAALLIWDSGVFQRRAVAATVGDVKLTVGEMQCYRSMVRASELNNQYYAKYYYGYTAYYSDPYQDYDFSSDDGDQQIYNTETGQTYAEHWDDTALTSAQQITAIVNAAKAAGYTLSEDGKSSVESSMESLESSATSSNYPNVRSYLIYNFGSYVTEDIYKSILTDQELAEEYQSLCQDGFTFDQADYDAYAEEHPENVYSYDFRLAFISGSAPSTVDEEGNTVAATDEESAAALAEAEAKADALVAGVQAAEGDKQEAFNTLVVDAVGETSSYANPESNLRTAVLGYDLSYYSSAYYDWVTDPDRAAGDIASIESANASVPGYYVILFVDRYLVDEPTVDVRHILIQPDDLVDDPDTPDVDESVGREDDPETEDIDESTVPTDEQLAAARAKAEDILAQFKAGEQTEDAFAALANEYSSDTGSNTAGGLYTYVEKGEMVENFDAWIFDPARQSGDTGIVENVEPGSNYYGYHVMYFVGQNDPRWTSIAKSALLSEASTTWLEDLTAAAPAAWTDNLSMVR